MRKAERLFQLVNILRVRQPVTAWGLADALGVSVRTIYRYIDDLSASGIPVYGEAGVGYRLDKNFELPPLTLTGDEIDALLLGVEMVSVSTGERLPAAARALLSKVEAALPDLRRPRDTQTARALCVTDRTSISGLWDQLQDAVNARRAVTFTYVAPDDARSQREVYPLGLFYWGGKWTMGAWCTLRQAFREFRLDRMHDVQVAAHVFELTDKINLQSYMTRQAMSWRERLAATDTTVSAGMS